MMDATRQDGTVGVSAAEDVGLIHRLSSGYRQVEPSEVEAWLRARDPKLAYRYETTGESGGRRLAVSTRLIQPRLLVEGQGVGIIGEEAVDEEYIFACRVSRRPLFRLLIRLPRGLVPINLFGRRVTDWEFHPESRLIAVEFDRGLEGASRIQLFCERRVDGSAPLPVGGVTVLGAEHVTGTFGVGTDANLKITPVRTEGVVSTDVRRAPALISSHEDVNLAFRWTGEDWRVACATETLEPLIRARTRTVLVFGAGIVRARTDIEWNIERAGVRQLRVVLPEGATPGEIEGAGVQGSAFKNGIWTVRLADPVEGDYTLRVRYEMHADPDRGGLTFPGVHLPRAARQEGTVSVYLRDPRLEVSVAGLRNVRRSARAEEMDVGDLASVGTFGYSGPDRSIEFQMKGHALAGGVRLKAEEVELATVVKREGRSITYMRCRLQNTGEQYFSLRLPEDALLWGTYVEAEPVRPIRGKENALAVPLLDAPRDEPFDLGVIWAQPSERLGVGASVRLAAPELDLPAREVRWNLHVPRDYQVVSSGGNMELTRRTAWYEHGLPGAARRWARAAWPLIRLLLWAVGGIIAAGFLVFILTRLRRWYAWRRQKPSVPSFARIRRWVLGALMVCFVAFLAVIIVIPVYQSLVQKSRSSPGLMKMSGVKNAMEVYAHDHDGRLPPNLNVLLEEGYLEGQELLQEPIREGIIRRMGPSHMDKVSPDDPVLRMWLREHDKVLVLHWNGTTTTKPTAAATAEMEAEDVRQQAPTEGPGIEELDIGSLEEAKRRAKERAQQKPEKLDIMGMQSAVRPQPEEPEPPPQAEQSAQELQTQMDKLTRRRAGKKKQERRDRHSRALQMAESYRKRGNLREAEQQYRRALQHAPESEKAQKGLQRIERLQADMARPSGEEGEEIAGPGSQPAADQPAEEKKPAVRSRSLGSMLTYRNQLQRELGSDWTDEISAGRADSNALSVVTGQQDAARLPSGARIERRGNELIITGSEQAVDDAEQTVETLHRRMVREVRAITRSRRQAQAELAVRRRAEARRRQAAARAQAKGGAGTVSGSRGAGPLPIEIAFPGFGTENYPFYMGFAGTSRPLVEVTCLRSGATMVLQGVVAGMMWLIVCLAAWRSPRVALVLGIVLAVLLGFMLKIGGGASLQYVVMALAGVVLAAPIVIARVIGNPLRKRVVLGER